jgi:hypothetical protein
MGLTDNLGDSATVTQQIAVGVPTPGGQPDDPITDEFTVVSSFWQVPDEEDDPEEECLDVWGCSKRQHSCRRMRTDGDGVRWIEQSRQRRCPPGVRALLWGRNGRSRSSTTH